MQRDEASSLAHQLINQHQLDGWKFEFDRAKRRAGCCMHSKKKITLSSYYVDRNDVSLVRDTILHEIAHALAYKVQGRSAGHGPLWKQICIRIGAKPERCYSNAVDMPQGQWKASCGGCARLFTKHRRPKAMKRWCGPCGPTKGNLVYGCG